jgi:hypothetical protein
MTFTKRVVSAAILGAAFVGSSVITSPAYAGYLVTLQEVGSDVFATGSGSLDLTGLTLSEGTSISPRINPTEAVILTASADVSVDTVFSYQGNITGPTDFGSGSITIADSGSGNPVGMNGSGFGGPAQLLVPLDYASGEALADSATYINRTFITLGVTPGTYEWTWGAGEDQNFTLVVGNGGPGPLPVPEPASFTLLGAGFASLLLAAALRRVRAKAG